MIKKNKKSVEIYQTLSPPFVLSERDAGHETKVNNSQQTVVVNLHFLDKI